MKVRQARQSFTQIRITISDEKEAAAFFDFLLRAKQSTSVDDFQKVLLSDILEQFTDMTIQHNNY